MHASIQEGPPRQARGNAATAAPAPESPTAAPKAQDKDEMFPTLEGKNSGAGRLAETGRPRNAVTITRIPCPDSHRGHFYREEPNERKITSRTHNAGSRAAGQPRTLAQSGCHFKKEQRNPTQENLKFRSWITATRRVSLRWEPRRKHRGLRSHRGGERSQSSVCEAWRETDVGEMESGFHSGAQEILGAVSRKVRGREVDAGNRALSSGRAEGKRTLEKLKSDVPDMPKGLQVFPPAAGASQG